MFLVIFRRNKTLIKSASGQEFILSPEDQKIICGATEMVQKYKKQGHKIVMFFHKNLLEKYEESIDEAIEECSNALGMFPDLDCILFTITSETNSCFKFEKNTLTKIYRNQESRDKESKQSQNYRLKNNIKISEIEICQTDYGEFLPDQPTGLLKLLMAKYKSSWSETRFVSTRAEDKQAANAANITFIDATSERLEVLKPDETEREPFTVD